MAQQQVLDHEVLARANAGQDAREREPEQFKHTLSIADIRRRELLPPHNQSGSTDGVSTMRGPYAAADAPARMLPAATVRTASQGQFARQKCVVGPQ
jgi:hypothetical protein